MSDPLRWRLSDGSPGRDTSDSPGEDVPDEGEESAEDPLSGLDPDEERRQLADELADEAEEHPDADPLAGAEHGGGYALGCGPEAEP